MRVIPLTKGYSSMIDDEYADLIAKHKWSVKIDKRGQNYARTRLKGTNLTRNQQCILMQSLILPCMDKRLIVDHINGNGLDNRISNLRLSTKSQNGANSKNYKFIFIGRYASEELAARAYDKWASVVFGEFAQLNFP